MRRWTIPDLEWAAPAADPGAVLSIDSLAVHYGRRIAVYDISLHVRAGEVVGLVGHNGSGKTSVLRAVAGLAARAGGTVVVQPGPDAEAALRYVPTTRPVFADLSVRDNLWLGAGPMAPAARAVRVGEVLALFPELAHHLDHRAGMLSGGEQRLVSIGITLMVHPALLLVDEPTQFLGPSAAAHVLRTVRTLADAGVAVLMAETSVAATAHIADRVYVLNSGRLRSEHTGRELLAGGPRSWWRLL